jgi:hypothetical protein
MIIPCTVVNLDEGGVGLSWSYEDRRAELEFLDDGDSFLTMYMSTGAIQCIDNKKPSQMLAEAMTYLFEEKKS